MKSITLQSVWINAPVARGVWLDAGQLETFSKPEKTELDKWFAVFKK